MLKIIKNMRSFDSVIDIVSRGITDQVLLGKIENCRKELINIFDEYEECIEKGTGFQLPTYDYNEDKGINPVVVGDLKHSEIKSIYSKFFVPSRFDSRDIYNEIKASAKEGCPYCGFLRDIEELDHFLPKSKYPQFSILTSNLIPSCKTCNQTYKKSSFATCYKEQIIHPYMDYVHFFEEKWIDAELNVSEYEKVRFFASPPESWSERDQERAKFHFEKFNLTTRNSILFHQEYEGIKEYIKKLKTDLLDTKTIISYIIEPQINLIVNPNDFRRVVYEAVKRELLQPKPVNNVHANLITCPRCRGDCSISGKTCDLCKGMGTIRKTIVSNQEVFKSADCPRCDLISLDLDCNICNGKGTISLDKARNIGK
ncbi:HNH endonuclease [Psychrobacter faecalis]|uniref:HNH endonuclease n=1 Tax=Psychrobacter faecalis TaxID=180588 RepID=UPI00191A020A|nr:HNH endonuclease [Psychrobacter faecalis]